MTTLLNQALILTLIGMGMTFGALGLLVLGMYAMTALITDKPRRKKAPVEEAPPEEALVTRVADVVLHLAAVASQPGAEVEAKRPRDEDREYAAAAAVALALALEDSMPHAKANDRYRAAAAAVAMAVASAGATPVPANAVTMPDPWSYHARGQQFARHRLSRTGG